MKRPSVQTSERLHGTSFRDDELPCVRSRTALNPWTRRRSGVRAFPARVCVLLVRGYQVTLGPLMGGHCRFQPTCSNYAIEAYQTHGVLRGSWLTLKRLLKCHPLSRRCGFDPVPHGGFETSKRLNV
jgi:uncharacterized protein